MIVIESKKKKIENILKKYPNAIVADVTSQTKDALVKLSPFPPWWNSCPFFTRNNGRMCRVNLTHHLIFISPKRVNTISPDGVSATRPRGSNASGFST